MELRRSATCIFVSASLVHAVAVAGQDLRPIRDRTQRIEIPGVSVLPPQSDGWFLFPVSKQEAAPPDALVRFVHKLQVAGPARSEDARSLVAAIVVQDAGKERSGTPDDFLQAFTGGDPNRNIGQMVTQRQRLIGFNAALDDSLGATCVRYNRLTEITGQFPTFPNLVAILSTHGLYCSHPRWSQYNIDVTYQQAYAKGQTPLPRDGERDAFLKGVVFTATRPSAVNGPR